MLAILEIDTIMCEFQLKSELFITCKSFQDLQQFVEIVELLDREVRLSGQMFTFFVSKTCPIYRLQTNIIIV